MCKLGLGFTKLVVFVIAALSLALFTANAAQAIQCGDTITSDTTLTANLNCGLVLRGTEITLDLNGYTIFGGLYFDAVQQATIKGPGTISTAGTAIYMSGGTGNVLVYNLTLRGTTGGIEIMSPSGDVRIFNNLILGKNQQGQGIRISRGGGVHVYQNTITGYSVGVFVNTEVAVVVNENLIALNQTGIWAGIPIAPASPSGATASCSTRATESRLVLTRAQ